MRTGDFADFVIFVAIAEEGSLRAAAARLDLQPSTVSHGLRSLEERLGVRLFHRTTRSVALTEAGQALLAQVAPALAALEAAEEVVNDFRVHPAGQVFDLGVPVPSALVLDDPELMLDAAARGLGLAYALDVFCHDALADGRLLPVLEGWLPRYDGFFLYYPNRQVSAALRALCEALREG